MSRGDLALALAAFFTFGGITIHEAREHARAMTPALVISVVCLGMVAGLAALAQHPAAQNPLTITTAGGPPGWAQ